MHGLIGGRWGSGLNLRGLLVPGRCAGIRHHDGLVGTSTAGAVCRTSGLPHKRCCDWAVNVMRYLLCRGATDLQLARVEVTEGLERLLGLPCHVWVCLLYTSDAADEEDSVDLG